MKDEKFDELFDEAFERAVNSASPVDPQSRRAAWHRVQKHRQQCSVRRRRKRTIRLTGAAAGLILFGSVAFSEPIRTGALNPFYQKLYTWSSGDNLLTTGEDKPLETDGALTPPPPERFEKPTSTVTEFPEDLEEPVVIRYDNVLSTMEEAKERLEFPMPEFPRIPPRFKLKDVYLSLPDDDSAPNGFTLDYRSDEGRILHIIVIHIPYGPGTHAFGGPVTKMKLDNGLTGYFIDMEGDDDYFKVFRGDLDISISGPLTQSEMAEVAGHIVDGKPRESK
ncbi:hypothetical protein [Saccharibacillus kuerlensis]|uniref:DUF4367 domain-containing protein n=1 Tax=Saccharibacillus kuerlensis TaxID=459527 RepID=A0ABQ2L454_9BACL|nr:hypothetical protein [Saccharibacillus kuerlensis]GGO02086.1 hypothetical protein GCM10010969_25040 [Saccharibacillus kuerlensis]